MASNTSFTPQEIEQFLQQFFDVVGARQYIGARYVPIFGRKGEDTIEWDNLAPYEPLTVVMHRGVSYVSKQYVPELVDITNTDYWVQTYRFNAQVEQYRQEVLSFQGQIDDRVPFPDPDFFPRFGTLGQVLSTLADGTTKWSDPIVPSDEQAEEVITQWLNDHPEATTTVEDGSITYAKLAQELIDRLVHASQVSVTSTNWETVLPNANYQPNDSIYLFRESVTESMTANLPVYGQIGILVKMSYSESDVNGNAQLYVVNKAAPEFWVRISSGSGSVASYGPWVRFLSSIEDESVGYEKITPVFMSELSQELYYTLVPGYYDTNGAAQSQSSLEEVRSPSVIDADFDYIFVKLTTQNATPWFRYIGYTADNERTVQTLTSQTNTLYECIDCRTFNRIKFCIRNGSEATLSVKTLSNVNSAIANSVDFSSLTSDAKQITTIAPDLEWFDGYYDQNGVLRFTQTSYLEKATHTIKCVNYDNAYVYIEPIDNASLAEDYTAWLRWVAFNNGVRTEIETISQLHRHSLFVKIPLENCTDIAFSIRYSQWVRASVYLQRNSQDIETALKPTSFVKAINHRGWNECPENTMPAFRQAALRGYKYIETDIRFTSDDVPVLLHDESINRTARNADGTQIQGTVDISSITYAQALEYDFGIYKAPMFEGVKIPTLEEFLIFCKKVGVIPYLELKLNYAQDKCEIIHNIVARNGMNSHVVYEGVYYPPVTRLSALNKDAPCGINSKLTSYTEQDLNYILEHTNNLFNFVNLDQVDSELITYLSENDIPLEVWTVDNPALIPGMDPYITGVCSNTMNVEEMLFNEVLVNVGE